MFHGVGEGGRKNKSHNSVYCRNNSSTNMGILESSASICKEVVLVLNRTRRLISKRVINTHLVDVTDIVLLFGILVWMTPCIRLNLAPKV